MISHFGVVPVLRPLVFQYGSNCETSEINSAECLAGGAQDLGRAQTLGEFEIAFNKWSQNRGCAASDLIPCRDQKAWGVLYEIPNDFIRGERTDGQKTLTQIEGKLYEGKPIRVRNAAGEEVAATTFLVKPKERRSGLWTSAAYVSWIICGLRAHGVPEDWISHVLQVAIETNERAATSAFGEIRLIRTL